METSDAGTTFVLVHGSWHRPSCWDSLRPELDRLGHESIAVDLPIDNPDATFDDYAEVVAEASENYENIVLVGHSRAGNVIPRVAGLIAVEGLVFLCPSFHPATTDAFRGLTTDKESQLPAQYFPGYESLISRRVDGLTEIAPKTAENLFYHDCEEDIRSSAAAQLRPQRRSDEEPILRKWPSDLVQAWILGKEDRVINPEWSRYVAKNWLGLTPIELPGGHSPFLARPRLLATTLGEVAAKMVPTGSINQVTPTAIQEPRVSTDRDIQKYWDEHYGQATTEVAERQNVYMCLPEGEKPPDYELEVVSALEQLRLINGAYLCDIGCSKPELLELFQILGYDAKLLGVEPNLYPAREYDRYEKISPKDHTFDPDKPGWHEEHYRFVPGTKRKGKGIHLYEGDANHIPLESNLLDLLIYKFSFYHVPRHEQDDALKEARRVLKPDGVGVWLTSGQENKQFLYSIIPKAASFLGAIVSRQFEYPPPIHEPFTTERALILLREHFKHVYVKFFSQQLIYDRPLYRDLAFGAVWSLRDRFIDEDGRPADEKMLFEVLHFLLVERINSGINSGNIVTDKVRRAIIFASDRRLDLPKNEAGKDSYLKIM